MIVGSGPGSTSRLWDQILEVAPQACNFTKKRVQDRCFLVNIAKFLRTLILKNIWNSCFWTRNAKRFNTYNNFSNFCFLEFSQTSVMELFPNNTSWKSTVLQQLKKIFTTKIFHPHKNFPIFIGIFIFQD